MSQFLGVMEKPFATSLVSSPYANEPVSQLLNLSILYKNMYYHKNAHVYVCPRCFPYLTGHLHILIDMF